MSIMLEELAALAHEMWMHWSRALVKDGEIISAERLARWAYFWKPYEELDEQSKEVDRKWAKKMLEIMSLE